MLPKKYGLYEKTLQIKVVNAELLLFVVFPYRVRVATMTHFCTFGTVISVLIISFG